MAAIKILRFIVILLHLFKGFFVFGFALDNEKLIKQGISKQKREKLTQWLKKLLKLFNIEVQVYGDKVKAPKMIVCNHVSWIDIVILSSMYPGHFIAKSEIKRWPIMGSMITNIGTLFVKRGVRSEIKTLSTKVEQIVENNSSIIFFPEGKIGDGLQINKIHTGLFQSAINGKMDIQPTLLIYGDSSGYPSTTVPYLNDQTLFESIFNVLGEKKISASLFVLKPIPSKGLSRKQIGEQLNITLTTQLEKEIKSN